MTHEQPLQAILEIRWLHSHEEDGAGCTVYRPETFAFPLSRGRAGFALHEDGSFDEIGIGAADRPEERRGAWRIEEEGAVLALRSARGDERKMRVLSMTTGKIVVETS